MPCVGVNQREAAVRAVETQHRQRAAARAAIGLRADVDPPLCGRAHSKGATLPGAATAAGSFATEAGAPALRSGPAPSLVARRYRLHPCPGEGACTGGRPAPGSEIHRESRCPGYHALHDAVPHGRTARRAAVPVAVGTIPGLRYWVLGRRCPAVDIRCIALVHSDPPARQAPRPATPPGGWWRSACIGSGRRCCSCA